MQPLTPKENYMNKSWLEVSNIKASGEVSVVELAIEAVEWNPLPNSLDMDMKGIGDSPSDLDLAEVRPLGRKSVVPIRVAVPDDENTGEVVQ